MFDKKGQAAMEFLMTYGWAILVVLVAIGALAYFGVLSPDRFLPERCTGTAGLDCIDKANIGPESVNISLKNNIGYPINITDIGASTTTLSVSGGLSCATLTLYIHNGTGWITTDNAFTVIPNNQNFIVSAICTSSSTAFSGPRVKGDIKLSYVNTETGLRHDAVTAIAGRGTG